MKKAIVGAAMLISGVIGLVGWFIACALTVQPGGRSRVWGCLDGMEWVPVIVFTVLEVYGLVLALKSTKNESELGEKSQCNIKLRDCKAYVVVLLGQKNYR